MPRVTLNYTVDVEEVPLEISRLINNVTELLENVTSSLKGASDKSLVNEGGIKALEDLDNARQLLVNVDYRLADAHKLLAQFLIAVGTLEIQKQEEPEEKNQEEPNDREEPAEG